MPRDFDGSDDLIDYGTSVILDSSTFTICEWLRLPTSDSGLGNVFVSRGQDTFGNGWSVLMTHGSGNPCTYTGYVVATTPTVAQVDAVGTNTFARLMWHHIALVWNPGTSLTLYVDGVLEKTTAETRTGLRSSTKGLRSGPSNTGGLSTGMQAYLSAHTRVLSVGEIRQMMYYPGSIVNGLAGFWPLWGGSPEGDYSGNGNSGTVTGATVWTTDGPPINGVFYPRRSRLQYAYASPAAPSVTAEEPSVVSMWS